MTYSYDVQAKNFTRAGAVSSEFKKELKKLNLPSALIKRIIIALYEGEVNVVAHSFGGTISCTISSESVDISIQDTGPGIPDIALAMKEGFSTASDEVREMGFGAGMGMANMKKNSDSLHITSEEGKETRIDMSFLLTFEEGTR